MKVLLAVDGSPHSRRAVKYVVTHWSSFGSDAALCVVHVDPPLTPHVARALGRQEVENYHADNAKAALRQARAALHRAGIGHAELRIVGEPGTTIAHAASTGRYDLVVMGSHGHGTFRNLVLGSVVTKVLHGCNVPVLVVR